MSIHYDKGDLLYYDGIDIRCHQVNCLGVMGAGIAKQIHYEFPEAFDAYRPLCKRFGEKLLGHAQFVACHDDVIIGNLFGQNLIRKKQGDLMTDYDAMLKALKLTRLFAYQTGSTVGFPKYIGAGLAGGDWNRIHRMIQDVFAHSGIETYIIEFDKRK